MAFHGPSEADDVVRWLPRTPVTSVTLVLALGVTAMDWTGRDTEILKLRPGVEDGEWWRFATTIFPHGGVLHLLFNLLWTARFGVMIERTLGSLATLAIFLVTGVGASMWEWALNGAGIGLSGVGYGLFGFLWVASKRDPRFLGALTEGTVKLFVFWFFGCVVATLLDILAIANVAHAAGCVLGGTMAFAFARFSRWRAAGRAATILLAGLGVLGATVWRPAFNRFSPNRGKWEYYLGHQAMEKDDHATGEKWLRRAAALRPDDAWHRATFAWALASLGRHEEAAPELQEALRLAPDDASLRQFVQSLADAAKSPDDGAAPR
jgi:membrane associated rhomboid family serine protease